MSQETSKLCDSPYTRVVSKRAEQFYIKFKLQYEVASPLVDAMMLKSMVTKAVTELHGHAAAAVDLLQYDQKKMEGILRVNSSGFVKLWSSLTLFSQYDERACVFHVCQVTPHLLALAANSRDFTIPVS
ncbi:ribonuclease P protein subunit p14-like [Anneissia japonica]|uniref:ribonuclease P protein subunit p14-like n=1 Tax=Anneissia japonica TaxID=1529436 RepID=UPI001425522B|nr:ribonuclease P protein subunit p14-like [Anneissia japonica]